MNWETNTKGHVWKTDEDGSIDLFGLDAEYHNGPICTVCDYSFCYHCEDEPEVTCEEEQAKKAKWESERLEREANKEKETVQKYADTIKRMIDVQRQNGNYNCNEYMYGMLVGLECAYYTLLGEHDFKYTERPKEWLDDKIPKDFKPEVVESEGCKHWRVFISKSEDGTKRDLICSDCNQHVKELDTSN